MNPQQVLNLLMLVDFMLLKTLKTGLDGLVARQLQTTLDNLANNATTIMVTHHLEDLQNVQQILYLKDRKIVERGANLTFLF